MTDNEIIKALECCCGTAHDSCRDCPYDDTGCEDKLEKDALDLINRQKAEIAELQHKIKCYNSTIFELEEHIEEQKEEIEELQKAGDEAVSCFTRMESLYKIKCKELEVAKNRSNKRVRGEVETKRYTCYRRKRL